MNVVAALFQSRERKGIDVGSTVEEAMEAAAAMRLAAAVEAEEIVAKPETAATAAPADAEAAGVAAAAADAAVVAGAATAVAGAAAAVTGTAVAEGVEKTMPGGKEAPHLALDVTNADPSGTLTMLYTILSYCRKHGSVGERAFIEEVLRPYLTSHDPIRGFTIGPDNSPDLQNFGISIPIVLADGATKPSRTMFSCHIDTCHGYSVPTKQKILVDTQLGHVLLDTKDPLISAMGSTYCLGADNGAGIWVLMQLINARVPGTYMFHRGEESGRIGSMWIARNRPDFLKRFDRSIAFDRKDVFEIITHQSAQRTASDKFGQALADGLNATFADQQYKLSTNGSYTDTYSYASVIPECTNVGVGYHEAHGKSEYLNYEHLWDLAKACLAVKWEELPTDRDPKVVMYGGHGSSRQFHHGYGYGYDDHEYGWIGRSSSSSSSSKSTPSANAEIVGRGKKKKNSRTTSAAPTPSPSPAPAPVVTAPAPAPASQARIGVQSWAAADFENYNPAEIFSVIDGFSQEDLANIICDLVEENIGLYARINYRRRMQTIE
jgi:hypothetical protein